MRVLLAKSPTQVAAIREVEIIEECGNGSYKVFPADLSSTPPAGKDQQ